MSIIKEFKTFALRGSMVDLAVGIVVGTTFTKVVNSLVADIIMPPIGILINDIDFSAWTLGVSIPGFSTQAELGIGRFCNTLIDFMIIAWVIFLIVKLMNQFHKKETSPTRPCPECAMIIPKKANKCGHCCSFVI